MDWKKIYNDLIEKAKRRGLKKPKRTEKNYVYYEKHHIIPRCLGGKDERDNYVLLTFREHVIAHKILLLLYPENKALMKSLTRMINCEVIDEFGTKRRKQLSSKEAQEIRELYVNSLTGEGNPNYGKTGVNASRYNKPHSEETKQKISQANKGRLVGDKNPMYGVHLTGDKNPMYGKFGKDHPAAKRIIRSDGKIFSTIKECAEYYNCSTEKIRKLLNDPSSELKLDPTNRNKKGDIN